jgi:hypothetical protein
MAEFTKEDFDSVKEEDYIEDEFGLALKGYLIVRAVFYLIGTFMILGALVALIFGATSMNDLVSNATGFNATSPILNDNFSGLQICMFVQAIYTIGALVCVVMTYVKRTRLFVFIDLGLFVVFVAMFFIMGSIDLLTNGSAWWLYFLFNPLFSLAGLIVGKHFPYMPMM